MANKKRKISTYMDGMGHSFILIVACLTMSNIV